MTTPLDTWLVCGNKVAAHSSGMGCTCGPADPTAQRSQEAINRLAREHLDETAAPKPRARKRPATRRTP
jgi:hypothetical protein